MKNIEHHIGNHVLNGHNLCILPTQCPERSQSVHLNHSVLVFYCYYYRFKQPLFLNIGFSSTFCDENSVCVCVCVL
jgi:hypothetical protein